MHKLSSLGVHVSFESFSNQRSKPLQTRRNANVPRCRGAGHRIELAKARAQVSPASEQDVEADDIDSYSTIVNDSSADEEKMQYAKYLPKGTSLDDVDWSVLGIDSPSSSPREPSPHSSRRRDSPEMTMVRTTDATFNIQLVQWYPGHIAKAERQLRAQLSKVDVVLEVRDARIPVSTWHPQVTKWVGAKPRLLLMNRIDMVSPQDLQQWKDFFKQQKQQVFWTDGKLGTGASGVRKALLQVGEAVNAKRARRDLMPRPVRACVIGFPNIGKSALINRLLNRRMVDSAPVPGVTRTLRWVRVGGEVDLLDAPGVIPASFTDQLAAQRLAMCNDIGGAAYEDSLIAAALIIRIKSLPSRLRVLSRMSMRYKLDPLKYTTAEDFVEALADRIYNGDRDRAGGRILQDFRTGALGDFSLEGPEDWLTKQVQGYT